MNKTCVLITNGNAMSMLALSRWMIKYGKSLRKVYVTYRLPSAKSNIRGVLDMVCNSGWSYTWLKVWANRFLPMKLHRKGLPASVGEFLKLLELDIPIENVDSVNTAEVLDEIRQLAPDYILSFSATQRFKEPLIESPTLGAINVHYGALPAYAGLSPYFWHLYNQESEFGVTVHQIVSKLDAGPIIEQVRNSTEGLRTCLQLAHKMADTVSPLLCRFFEGTTTLADSTPQPSEGRSYFRHPSRSQIKEFKAAGFAMQDAASRSQIVAAIEQVAAEASQMTPGSSDT